jgi:hypothetical protein
MYHACSRSGDVCLCYGCVSWPSTAPVLLLGAIEAARPCLLFALLTGGSFRK